MSTDCKRFPTGWLCVADCTDPAHDEFLPTTRPAVAHDTGRPATAALARGLYDLDRHKWGHIGDYESLRPHYERDAERFLLPHLTECRPTNEEQQ